MIFALLVVLTFTAFAWLMLRGIGSAVERALDRKSRTDAVATLNNRLVLGDITQDEYRQLRSVLEAADREFHAEVQTQRARARQRGWGHSGIHHRLGEGNQGFGWVPGPGLTQLLPADALDFGGCPSIDTSA